MDVPPAGDSATRAPDGVPAGGTPGGLPDGGAPATSAPGEAPAEMVAGGGERLLVVDDEPTVRELLAATLRFAGFTVTSAATGREALDAARADPPDLVLLDVMLPDLNGFDVVRRLRELPTPLGARHAAQTPVLFLTARDAPQDKVTGLTLGGDDYVTKPFDLAELIARIRAVLRRTNGGSAGVLRVGDLALEPEGHHVSLDGAPVRLSPTEFRLLHFLLLNAGRVMSRTTILEQVWHYDFGGDTSIVDTYISYLRRKLDSADRKVITTVHGVGYVVRPPSGP